MVTVIKTLAPRRVWTGRGPQFLVGNVVLERPQHPLENRGNGHSEALRMRRLLAPRDAFPFRGAFPGEARGASVRHGCLGPSGSYKRSEVFPEPEEYRVTTPGQDQKDQRLPGARGGSRVSRGRARLPGVPGLQASGREAWEGERCVRANIGSQQSRGCSWLGKASGCLRVELRLRE